MADFTLYTKWLVLQCINRKFMNLTCVYKEAYSVTRSHVDLIQIHIQKLRRSSITLHCKVN
jgi:hypothetical protein